MLVIFSILVIVSHRENIIKVNQINWGSVREVSEPGG